MFKFIHRLLFVLILGWGAVAPSFAGTVPVGEPYGGNATLSPGSSVTFGIPLRYDTPRQFYVYAKDGGQFRLTVADSAGGIWCEEEGEAGDRIGCDLSDGPRLQVMVIVTNLGDTEKQASVIAF